MRDVYGFLVPPELEEQYQNDAAIVMEREEKQAEKWDKFLLREIAKDDSLSDTNLSSSDNNSDDSNDSNISLVSQAEKNLRSINLNDDDNNNNDNNNRSRSSSSDNNSESLSSSSITDGNTTTTTSNATFSSSHDKLLIEKKKLVLARVFDEPTDSQSRAELTELVESGIPMAMRKFVWPLLLEKHEQRYDDMLNTNTPTPSPTPTPTSASNTTTTTNTHNERSLSTSSTSSVAVTETNSSQSQSQSQSQSSSSVKQQTKYMNSVLPSQTTITSNSFWNTNNSNNKKNNKTPLPDYNYQLKNIPLQLNAQWISQIKKDLPRTFPDHPALDGRGRSALGRVLAAYVAYNNEDGYCQGMNFIAGVLILFLPEEIAFKSLARLLQVILRGYHAQDLKTLLVDQRVFDHLLQEKFPDVSHHLTALDVKSSSVTAHWFLTAFVNALQMEALLRVWDVLLFEGSISVLMRVALAMVKARREKVLSTDDSADVFAALQQMPANTSRLEMDALLVDVCCNYSEVNDEKINALRIINLKHVEEEFKLHNSKRQTQENKSFGKFFTKFTQTFTRTSSSNVSSSSLSMSSSSLSPDSNSNEEADQVSEMNGNSNNINNDDESDSDSDQSLHRTMSACTTQSELKQAKERTHNNNNNIDDNTNTTSIKNYNDSDCDAQTIIIANRERDLSIQELTSVKQQLQQETKLRHNVEQELSASLEVIAALQEKIRKLEAKLNQ